METQIDIPDTFIEGWRVINWYDGRYLVSNLGRVKDLGTEVTIFRLGKRHKRRLKPKILTKSISKTGYNTVSLNGKNVKLHRVIAEAFIPNPLGLPLINHKNGVKTDNRLSNLEWCSQSGNLRHAAYTLGTMHLLHPMRKVICIDTGKVYDSLAEAARDTGARAQNIYHVCNGHWQKTANLRWRYADGN